jgi:predicted AAA+ superfamily ATPase
MAADRHYRRFTEAMLLETLADTPAVLIHGPRQCGKTTLAKKVGEARDYAYFSFDDDVTLASAKADPVGFVGDLPARAVLDEVQRAPVIFPALKYRHSLIRCLTADSKSADSTASARSWPSELLRAATLPLWRAPLHAAG